MPANSKTNKLFLLPNTLSYCNNNHWKSVIPTETRNIITDLNLIFAETPKVARNFLKTLENIKPIQAIDIYPLNQYTKNETLELYLTMIKKRKHAGILSDAGCACIADPGQSLVRKAHKAAIQIVPLVGPNAILLALMASGLNGQKFTFHGYLPKESNKRNQAITELEQRSRNYNETQIFIETPYRNEALFKSLITNLANSTSISIAIDLTMPQEAIYCHTIMEWKKMYSLKLTPNLQKKQAVFLLLGHKQISNNTTSIKYQNKT